MCICRFRHPFGDDTCLFDTIDSSPQFPIYATGGLLAMGVPVLRAGETRSRGEQ
jgi:hypothetical protein